MKYNNDVTPQRLKEILHYDKDTGVFTWLISPARRSKKGDIAGTLHRGYVEISILHKKYSAHRLAWLYMTGAWPLEEIDHKNGIPSDNRFDNLREADRYINCQNLRSSKGKNALLGVYPRSKKFFAAIRVNGKSVHLGSFDTQELAHSAYLDAKRKHHSGCTI